MCKTSLVFSMGCINSKRDTCPTVFQCVNIDELGTPLNAGQLEVTESDLIFYQRGKTPIRWPLKTLRRYGFEAQQFSFESGRKSPTGAGVYAFMCRRAEALVVLLESRLQVRPQGGHENNGVRRSSHGRHNSIGSGSLLSPVGSINPILGSLPNAPSSRPLSQNIYANDSLIASASTPSTHAQDEKNNNSVVESTSDHTYANTLLGGTDAEDVTLPAHLYMNVVPGTASVLSEYHAQPLQQQQMVPWEQEEIPAHNYANLDLENELEFSRQSAGLAKPILNYILLDLDHKGDPPPPRSPSSSLPPDSPKKSPLGYATIDFDKTTALSHSVGPTLDDSDCSRKTRHNSTISQMPNSSSVSE